MSAKKPKSLPVKSQALSRIEPEMKRLDNEKITINLGFVDLGQIDLLVRESFYANRSDFIRTAIRAQLTSHGEVVAGLVTRSMLVLGLQHYSRDDLLRYRAAGERIAIRGLGLVTIAQDVSPELAAATIESIDVLGSFHASPKVRKVLAGGGRG